MSPPEEPRRPETTEVLDWMRAEASKCCCNEHGDGKVARCCRQHNGSAAAANHVRETVVTPRQEETP